MTKKQRRKMKHAIGRRIESWQTGIRYIVKGIEGEDFMVLSVTGDRLVRVRADQATILPRKTEGWTAME
jgi:hypothetical protein